PKNPTPEPLSRRVGSPSGAGSTLITSAPRSASTMPADGPMIACENSATVRPRNGSEGSDMRLSLSRRKLGAEHEVLAALGAQDFVAIDDPATKATAVGLVHEIRYDRPFLQRKPTTHHQPDLELVATGLRDLVLHDGRD